MHYRITTLFMLFALFEAGLSVHANVDYTSAVVARYGCGTGCYVTHKQLEPISSTNIGLPRVKVQRTFNEVQSTPPYSERTFEKSVVWIIADCNEGLLTNGAYNSNGIDKPWEKVYSDEWNEATGTTAYYVYGSDPGGRLLAHWYRLCKAAGYHTKLMQRVRPANLL